MNLVLWKSRCNLCHFSYLLYLLLVLQQGFAQQCSVPRWLTSLILINEHQKYSHGQATITSETQDRANSSCSSHAGQCHGSVVIAALTVPYKLCTQLPAKFQHMPATSISAGSYTGIWGLWKNVSPKCLRTQLHFPLLYFSDLSFTRVLKLVYKNTGDFSDALHNISPFFIFNISHKFYINGVLHTVSEVLWEMHTSSPCVFVVNF